MSTPAELVQFWLDRAYAERIRRRPDARGSTAEFANRIRADQDLAVAARAKLAQVRQVAQQCSISREQARILTEVLGDAPAPRLDRKEITRRLADHGLPPPPKDAA